MVPKQEPPFLGMAKLLQHFKWTWIGLLAPDNDQGERFLSTFTDLIGKRGLCVAFTARIKALDVTNLQFDMKAFLMQGQVNAVVYQTDPQATFTLALLIRRSGMTKPTAGRVWIAMSLQDLSLWLSYRVAGFRQIHGSLSFSIQEHKCTEYDNFDSLFSAISLFGKEAFHCFHSRPVLAVKGYKRCMEKERREILPQTVIDRVLSQDSYSIYNTIQNVAQALHAALASRPWRRRLRPGLRQLGRRIVQPWQVLLFLHIQDVCTDHQLCNSRNVQLSEMSRNGFGKPADIPPPPLNLNHAPFSF